MVFRARGTKTFKLRIRGRNGVAVTHSTGARTKTDAKAVEAVVAQWLGRQGRAMARPKLVALLTAKPPALALREAYAWHLDGSLDRRLAAMEQQASDVDLHPLVEAWHRRKAKGQKGAASADNYRRQVRLLFPADQRFTRSMFTRAEVWTRLTALERSAPTKNRIRAAVSSFAKDLRNAGVIETNFVRDIDGFGEHDPRMVYYQEADAKQLIGALEQPYAGIAAMALAFAAEWGAIARTEVADLELKANPPTCRVRGSKRAWRDRVVPLVPEFAWLAPYLKAAVKGMLPTARPFAHVPEWRALRLQQETAAALKIVAVNEDPFGQHTIHDWRHDHAVTLLRAGYSEQIAAAHLGHRNTDLVRKNYGVFRPDRLDYARKMPHRNSNTKRRAQ